MEKLEWLPLYIDKLLSSPAWQDMKDYQRGWYIQLLLRCSRSERLGYLRMESNLWMIAGASRPDFWESHKSLVMACFEIREMDGHRWLYNKRLLEVMEQQHKKIRKRSPSISPDSPDVFVSRSVSKFIKPTLAEIKSYCQFRNNSVDPETFFDYQESVGWMVGKKKMKDWQAAVRTWERNEMGKSAPVQRGNCGQHPNSGLTDRGTCYGCYREMVSGASA